MSLSPNDQFGPYTLISPLGEGGMGEVWKARDTRLDRIVALKVAKADFTERFDREARAVAALNHPNICTLYDVGPNYLVMELIEGETLAEKIAAGPIPVEEALVLARQIGDALEAAHEKGIVHRDLKPVNIKSTAGGQLKVLDFGLAKAFDSGVSSVNPANSPTLTMSATQAGVIMGTAGYMSPEQARGKPVDKRADIWAFGVVLLEMLTGRSTFAGETVSDTLAAVLRADIDWRELPAGTPPKVRRLLRRCLERDAKKRLRDIGDAWLELDAPDEAAPAAPVAPVTRRRAGLGWLGWAAALAIGVAAIGWILLHRAPVEPQPVVRWTYAQKDFFGYPALSRDGSRMLLTTAATQNASNLAVRMMDQLEAKQLPGSDNLYFGEFSSDGQWIAAFAGGSDGKVNVKKIPVTGGTSITLAETAGAGGLSWGDDGTIVFSDLKKLMRVSSSGGKAETLTTPDANKGELAHRTPHFLPGARALVFSIATAAGSQIAVLDLKNGGYHVVVDNGQDGRYAPTGHLVYTRGNTLFAEPFDAERLRVTGPEAPVIEGLNLNGPNLAMAEYAFAGSGLLVYLEGGGTSGTTLAWADRRSQLQPLSDAQLWGTGRLSPDGRRIANTIHSGSSAASPGDIWVFEIERKTKTRLTIGGDTANPIWTPDGRRITYVAKVDGKSGIYSLAADGSGQPEQLLATDSPAMPNSWSPDGKFLFYTEHARIWALPVQGGVAGKPFPLHDAAVAELDGEVSPDGRWVAYASNDTGQYEIYVQAFPGPGGKERVSTEGALTDSGSAARWARNGRELFYRTNNGVMTVEVQARPQFHVGLPALVVKGQFGTTFDATPDGKRFLVEQIGGSSAFDRRMIGVSNWFEDLRRVK